LVTTDNLFNRRIFGVPARRHQATPIVADGFGVLPPSSLSLEVDAAKEAGDRQQQDQHRLQGKLRAGIAIPALTSHRVIISLKRPYRRLRRNRI